LSHASGGNLNGLPEAGKAAFEVHLCLNSKQIKEAL